MSVRELDEFRQQLLLLNGGVMQTPNSEVLRLFASLGEAEQMHDDLAIAIFHFLKSPHGEPSTPSLHSINQETNGALTMQSLQRYIDPIEPFGQDLSLHALRNWFLAVNSIVIISQGSESKLKFKYLALPPLTAITFNMAVHYPEFLSRLMDYIDGWSKRCAYDTKAINILLSAYRGEMASLEKSIAHSNTEIAGHFIALREEALRTGEKEVPSILPGYLLGLMAEWRDATETSNSGEASSEVEDWYRVAIGQKLLTSIEVARQEIDQRFGPMLAKYKELEPDELSRNKGQVSVLLRREVKRRAELLDDELKLISWLDSRHALLARKFDSHARILLALADNDHSEA